MGFYALGCNFSSLLYERLRQRDAIRQPLYFGRSLERNFHNINFLPDTVRLY
ncbi:MAG: hypothetical protein V7L23_26715 [Nostoc sp.]|uniref:hypothetical protein n=1 Tax=Nostoc sp. TaxID=1180 RepID=UPI002FF02D63